MLDSLLELILLKKESIRSKVEEFEKVPIDSDRVWINYTSTDTGSDKIISAGDGSINKKKYLSFTFFML